MVHGQAVNHLVAHGHDCSYSFIGRVVAGQVIEKQVLDAVGCEVEKYRGTAGHQTDQDTENDGSGQQSPVGFFQFVEKQAKIRHGC